MKSELSIIESMSLEAIEAACQSAFEEVESVFQIVEKNRNRLEYFGRLLTAAKAKVEPGKWQDWVTDTFQGRLALRTARRWMLESGRPDLAADRREKDKSRIAGWVKVSEPVQTAVQPKESDTWPQDASAQEVDTQDRPTIRTTPAGTQRVSEAGKNRTAVVTPEIVEEPKQSNTIGEWFRAATIDDVVTRLIERTENNYDQKKTAAALRKWADKLDPPKVESIPSAGQLVSRIPETWSGALTAAAGMWARYRQGLAKAKRIQNLEAWETALKRMTEQSEKEVIRKIEKAVESSWQGWDVETGKANGNGSHLGDNGRPAVTRAKVTYK